MIYVSEHFDLFRQKYKNKPLHPVDLYLISLILLDYKLKNASGTGWKRNIQV